MAKCSTCRYRIDGNCSTQICIGYTPIPESLETKAARSMMERALGPLVEALRDTDVSKTEEVIVIDPVKGSYSIIDGEI